jgi:L-lactate dehydrogenase complex protein LldF
MTASMKAFRRQARIAVQDVRLQNALDNATSHFREGRVEALAVVPDVEEMRDHFKRIRAATIANLGEYLETFERNALRAGAHVHWAGDGEEAARIVVEIGRSHGIQLAAKSKSMVTEEIYLNQKLTESGIRPIETDLGEWIIQLAEETPSHIIAPAIHKTKEQVADLFRRESGQEVPADIPTLTLEARRMLREKFLEAGMGISGGNIGVAETGSIVLVTNEGNGRMVTSLPPVHVAVIGIEKIAPSWDEAGVWLSLLARSATGQPFSIYTSIITGPAKSGDVDGPQEVHIILLDNNRSRILGTVYQEVLQCIRCGACLNVCPVYREAGGHAYGSPYSGPIGAVISPLIFGKQDYAGLPQASSLCGACLDVCPARIDLPRMLLALRVEQVEQKVLPWKDRLAERLAAFGLGSLKRLKIFSRIGRWLQKPFVKKRRLNLPGVAIYPVLAERSFHELWQDLEDES